MSLPGEGSGRDERLDVIAAAECRELAKSFRTRAAESGSSQKASLLRNIAHSFSALATQLEGLADVCKAHDGSAQIPGARPRCATTIEVSRHQQ